MTRCSPDAAASAGSAAPAASRAPPRPAQPGRSARKRNELSLGAHPHAREPGAFEPLGQRCRVDRVQRVADVDQLEQRPVPMLSVPANTPPGRSTRSASANARSCSSGAGQVVEHREAHDGRERAVRVGHRSRVALRHRDVGAELAFQPPAVARARAPARRAVPGDRASTRVVAPKPGPELEHLLAGLDARQAPRQQFALDVPRPPARGADEVVDAVHRRTLAAAPGRRILSGR